MPVAATGSRAVATNFGRATALSSARSYERFAAGEYKDAGTPLKELEEDEREYLQTLIDDYYETFVDRVSDGRDLDEEFVRDTEARIYLGEEAHEMGLVDTIGTRRDLEDELAERLDKPTVSIEEFEAEQPLMARLGTGAQQVAYAFGAGIAGLTDDRTFRLRL